MPDSYGRLPNNVIFGNRKQIYLRQSALSKILSHFRYKFGEILIFKLLIVRTQACDG